MGLFIQKQTTTHDSLTPSANCRKMSFPAENKHFPTEKYTCLPKNAFSCRKMHFPAEKCGFEGHIRGNRRRLQEGFRAQEARTLANFHKICSATRRSHSHNHSYVHDSLYKFAGEWFTNHSNHIPRFTPTTRIVATKDLSFRQTPTWQRSQNPPRLKKSRKSPGESLRGSWPTPQNESKTSLQSQKAGDF